MVRFATLAVIVVDPVTDLRAGVPGGAALVVDSLDLQARRGWGWCHVCEGCRVRDRRQPAQADPLGPDLLRFQLELDDE